MEEPQSQLQLRVTDCRDTRIMGKIKDFLFSQSSAINASVVERRIQELFTSFETPTHPPYALMIQEAVKELNERNGSTEEAISEFIKNEFQHLPWAHSRILGLHLKKLCQAKELFRTDSGTYTLMDDYYKFDERKEKGWRGGRRRKKNRRGRNHRGGETLERIEGAERCNNLHERKNEEKNHLSELHGTGTDEPIEEEGQPEIGQLGVTEACHELVVQGQDETETRQIENSDERIQEAIMELNDKISSSEIMSTEPHIVRLVERQNPMVIKLRIQCEKQSDNLRGEETLQRTEDAERCNELLEHENEEQNQLSDLHGTGTNQMIEEQGKSEMGQPGVTEECHGRWVQEQGQGETRQNENTDKCEKQIEATTQISRFCSDEISNNENLSSSLGYPTVAENQCENQSDNLLAMVENQSLTQHIEATTEVSRFCSDEISNNENLSASLSSPTVAVIPKEKLQTSEQEEQHQNETPSVQQKFSGACELLVDQEALGFHMETPCSSLLTAPDLPIDLTSNSQTCLTLPVSTEFLEHAPSEWVELTPTQLPVQTLKCGIAETDLYAATKTLACMTVHGHKQQDDMPGSPKGRVEESTAFWDLEKHMPITQCGEWQPNEKSFTDSPEVSLLPSDGSIGNTQKPKYKQLQLRPQGEVRGRGRGRSFELDRSPHQHKEQLQLQDQALTSVSFPSLEPDETIYSLPNPNLPAAPKLQQLVDPTSEDGPGCTTRETSQLQLELQMSWQRLVYGDLGTASKMEDSLSSMSGLEDKPQQHGNKGRPKRKLNLDGKTEFGHLEQKLPKRRRRGRPPNPVPTEDCSWTWVPVAPSNNGSNSERNPNFYNIVTHRRLQSPGSIERHCEFWPQDQGQVQVHSPNLADDNNPSWEQTQRTGPKQKSDADRSCQKQMLLRRSSSKVRHRGELVQLKLSNAYQNNQQLSPETCQSQGKRLLRSSLTKSNWGAS
ncbi:uncharacterized protein LOC114753640 [Neltuma alba]|uniref:uncharacterized protein LOC114733324 n=1 Tax=Neltuma alba TaxID=207710 RepID=UPI0010A2F71E|nr:uncharacterized protein LOC114733324 [Prosopis alba]XP_028798174.1 uncharacterized protein LOC114753640 [Prosopis alba]